MRLIHLPLAAAVFYIGLSISIAPAQQSSRPAGPRSSRSSKAARRNPARTRPARALTYS